MNPILIIFIILLFLSAFFSGSEIAFLNIKKSHKKAPIYILDIINNSKKLLIGLLSGNTIVNISIAFIGAYFIHDLAELYSLPPSIVSFVEIICLSLVLLIFGEIIPKVFAMRNSIKFAKSVYFPLKLIFLFLSLLIFLLNKFSDFFEKILSVQDEKIFDSEEELKILTELGEEQGALEEEESEMIQSIINFNDKLYIKFSSNKEKVEVSKKDLLILISPETLIAWALIQVIALLFPLAKVALQPRRVVFWQVQ